MLVLIKYILSLKTNFKSVLGICLGNQAMCEITAMFKEGQTNFTTLLATEYYLNIQL